MLVSFNWLKEFVEIDRTAYQVADLLTMGGIEIENVTPVGQGLGKVVTARIEEIAVHPQSDKLSLAKISLGDDSITVVCGAPNIRVGQVVPYVPPGATLPSGMEIEGREIKGVFSPGMICSEKELGIGDDASGILILNAALQAGLPLPTALPFVEDFMLEASITPNRGDCLSVLGIARDVAALSGTTWSVPRFLIEEGPVKIDERASIEVPDFDLCPR